jgi:hypothetical protein
MNYANELQKELRKDGHELLYLVKFGSHLYGTSTPDSDLDLKGIFLPSKESALLGKMPKHYTKSTGERDSKNSKDDVDTQLWSLQYWLELVGKGETNGLDLLYSHTYPEMVLYKDPFMDVIFNNANRLFTTTDCNSYVGYAIGQAKKYGVKGSRMGVIKRVVDWMDRAEGRLFRPDEKLEEFINELLASCQDDSYCFVKDLKGSNGKVSPYLVLCGSKHDLTISLAEFYKRVKTTYDKYGDRAKAAERNEGIDFKALSHAVRAVDQMRELLLVGEIRYPLESAPTLVAIKKGVYSWNEVEKIILDGLDEIDSLRKVCDEKCKLDSKLVKNLVLDMYK